MPKKIELAKVADALKRHSVQPELARGVIEDLNRISAAEGPDDEAAPRQKKQFVFVLSDPEGRLGNFDFAGWVMQLPEEESAALVLERVHTAAHAFNSTRKGRKLGAKTLGEALEAMPSKLLKEQSVWLKTKSPILVVRSDNKIPAHVAVE